MTSVTLNGVKTLGLFNSGLLGADAKKQTENHKGNLLASEDP